MSLFKCPGQLVNIGFLCVNEKLKGIRLSLRFRRRRRVGLLLHPRGVQGVE